MSYSSLPFAFRRAGPEDRGRILALSSLFPNDWIPHALDDMLAEERGGFYVAELGGRLVAVCAAAGRGETAWLQAMRVHPDFQGRGVATALTAYILDECKRLGYRSARLFTAVTNDPVHRLIRGKLGFRARGRFVIADGIRDLRPFRQAPDLSRVRVGRPADLEDAWALCERAVREGAIDPPGLAAPPGDPWRVDDFTRETLAGHLEAGRMLVSERKARARPGQAGAEGATDTRAARGLDGFVLWHRPAGRPQEPEDQGDGGASATVFYLEATGETVASLLAAAVAAIQSGGTVTEMALSLPRSQWEKLMRVVRPGWPPAGPSEEVVVYEKNLTAGGDRP